MPPPRRHSESVAAVATSSPALSRPARIAVAALACVLAPIVSIAAFGMSYGNFAPHAAIGLWPANGRAYAKAATQVVAQNTKGDNPLVGAPLPERVHELAVRALRLEPSASTAVRDLAFYENGRGNRDRARRLMRAAAGLTRRNPGINLWLVDDYQRLGQSDRAVFYYDVTLRTSTSALGMLLPVMAKSLADPAGPVLYERILVTRPPWHDAFWEAVIQDGTALQNAFELRRRLHARKVPLPRNHDGILVSALASAGKHESAFALFEAAGGQAAPAGEVLQDGDFARPSDFAPITWNVQSQQSFGATLDPSKGELLIAALPDAAGVAAQQLVRMEKGRYNLSIRYAMDVRGYDAPLRVRFACAENGGEAMFSQALPVGRSGSQYFSQPTSCRFVWVTVELTPEPGAAGTDVRIDSMSIRRAD